MILVKLNDIHVSNYVYKSDNRKAYVVIENVKLNPFMRIVFCDNPLNFLIRGFQYIPTHTY